MAIFGAWRRLITACLAGTLLLAGIAIASAQPRRVLLLHSFGPHFAPWSAIAGRFQEELIAQSPYEIDLYEASLQSGRFGQSQDEEPFLNYLHGLFAESGLDLVVALGAPAARFFQRRRPQLFPSTPLLIAAADERTFNGDALTIKDAVVALAFDQAKQIEHILQVLPATANIAVVIGDSPLEKFWVPELRQAYQPFMNRVAFDWFNELSLDEMVKRVKTLPAHSAIYYATVRVDAHGVPQEEDRVLARLREVASAPIFSYIDTNFGQGIVGGPLLSTQEIARRSAAVAVRILSGETAGNIKTPPLGLGTPIYDWRELKRWSISEAVLPSGSEIRFRGPTAWQEYRTQVIVVFATLLAQGALIFWLLYERGKRRVAEAAARQTMSDLSYVNRMATAGELSASIAHEVKQPLAGIVSHANAGVRWLAKTPPDFGEVEAAFKQIVAAGHHANDVIGSVLALFKKSTAQERAKLNINDIIRNAVSLEQRNIENHDVSVLLELNESVPDIIGDRVQLLQVILNLIKNAIEAMTPDRARTLRVKSALEESGAVLLSVEDSGTGIGEESINRIFDSLYTTKPQGLGIGLAICRSIIENHDGRLWVTSKVGQGSTFFIKLPRYRAGDGWEKANSREYAKSAA
jgi:signal transduction histidine kinase